MHKPNIIIHFDVKVKVLREVGVCAMIYLPPCPHLFTPLNHSAQ
jgi:hypothetical protein